MPPLVLEGVVAGYRGAPVLDGLSLTVGERERVGLFGPNSHGKITPCAPSPGSPPKAGDRYASPIGRSTECARCDRRRGLIHVPQSNLLFPETEVLKTLRRGGQSPRARPRQRRPSTRS